MLSQNGKKIYIAKPSGINFYDACKDYSSPERVNSEHTDMTSCWSVDMNPLPCYRLIFGRHKVVIVEGNYLLLEEDTWKDLSALFDEKW